MPAMPIFRRMQSPYPSWVGSLQSAYRLSSPVLAIDPYNTRYFRAGSPRSVSDALSTDWAGGGLILGADGAYQSFSANQAPVLSGVGLDVWKNFTNGFADPEDFTTASWTKNGGATVIADAAPAPDGTTTMDKIVEGSGAGSIAQVNQAVTHTTGVKKLAMAHVKAAELDWFKIGFSSALGSGVAFFDLTNGVVGTTSNLVSYGMVPLADGSYICYAITSPTGSGSYPIYLGFGATDNFAPHTGDGVSGGYLWGTMAVDSAIRLPYAPATRYAINATDPDFAALASAYGLSSGLKIGASISLDRLSDPADRCVWSLGADADNCARIDVTTSNTAKFTLRASASDVLTMETTAFGSTGDKAITATLKDGAWALEATGVTGDSDAGSYGLPTLSSFRYGSKFGNSAYLNGDLNNLVLGRAA